MGGLLPKIKVDELKEEASYLQERLVHSGFVKAKRSRRNIQAVDGIFMNRLIVFSWPFFSIYLLTQPWLSDWANDSWYWYSANYTQYMRNGSTVPLPDGGKRPGMCDTPAKDFFCSDGQNFTELALKSRGKAVGCGCGQGFLGEGLCPMTSYGYTLSDFVSTEPGIALMLGLGFFPLLGTWRNTMLINELAKPSLFWESVHMWSMAVFQISFILWGICSDCIFPFWHSVLTVVFLGSFLLHWVVTACIALACMGAGNIESMVTLYVAFSAIGIMGVGAIPRAFLTLNGVLGTTFFPNLNFGLLSYSFWFAEALGLSLTFGAYPVILIAVYYFPQYSDFNKDGDLNRKEMELFSLTYESLGQKIMSEKPVENTA